MKKTPAIAIIGTGTDVMALAEKYPLDITAVANGAVAEIRISGVISGWENSAEQFKGHVDSLLGQGIKDVSLHINTPGGSVFEANQIENEIKRFPGTVSGFGGALVASAGSYLAMVCDTFEMAENGQYMYHKPMAHFFGNEDKAETNLQLLKNLTSQYRTAYASKTGLTEDDIESRWSKGDVWLSAKDAKEQGFITAVSAKTEKITEGETALFVACGAPKIPIVQNSNTDMKNRDQIIAKLGLPKDASDEQMEAAIDASLEKGKGAEDLLTAQQEAAKVKAETLVDASIAAKKCPADKREPWIKMAVKDYENTKAILDGLPAGEKISDKLDPKAQGGDKGKEGWTLQDYLDKDPVALHQLAAADPEKFQALNEAHYGN